VVPRCRHAAECGGCDWQHVRYATQLEWKRSTVAALLERALGRPVAVSATLATTGPAVGDDGAPWGFRNKVHFVFAPDGRGGIAMGHHARGSRRVVPIDECPVHADAGNEVAFAIRDHLASLGIPGSAEDGARGIARHVVVRVAHATGERVATLVVTRDDERRLRPLTRRVLAGPAAPDGFFLNVHAKPSAWLFGSSTRHLHGRARLRDEVAGASFLISPTAFFQTNVCAAEAMVQVVLEAVAGVRGRRVLDLYAGAGLFALPLARAGCEVVAVEENAQAVEAGEASRGFNRLEARSCRFVRARTEDYVAGRAAHSDGAFSPDVVVLDPPREGCSASVLAAVLERWQPRLLVYVSCNPEALAADLSDLARTGALRGRQAPYQVDAVRPIDMFPHTTHVEVVATLRRREGA
jgi:23S rRNA (uracil1939-C5)-methyltransferase